MIRRLLTLALAITLVAWAPSLGGNRVAAAPEAPPSEGKALLYHLELAENIDTAGNPIGLATAFPTGTKLILAMLAWTYVEAGTELKVRVFEGDRLLGEIPHTVVNSNTSSGNVGFVYPLYISSGFPDGNYTAELDYNGVPDEIVPFTVGGGDLYDAAIGSGTQSGPIPYASPSDVLVVTRESVLRPLLGSRTEEVLAAARRVGDLHDLEEGGTSITTADDAVAKVQSLLRARAYKYLLIVGNDDAVPYVRLQNPLEDSEAEELKGWELPADWVPTDNYYTDLDADKYATPDLATARIPSSDDADLILAQLADNTPPDGSGFALINQAFKWGDGLQLGAMGSVAQVQLEYTPPVDATSFGGNPAANGARYLFVDLHGIGVTTDSWYTDTVAWQPVNAESPLDDEWSVALSGQTAAVTLASNPTNQGVVLIGACYGGWTLDTVQAPQHKTSDNSLALHYLKGRTRAFIANTHIGYGAVMAPDDPPKGANGFAVLFWNAVAAGQTPIDAFQTAKVGMAQAIDTLVAAGNIDSAKVDLKTLHYTVYLGRP